MKKLKNTGSAQLCTFAKSEERTSFDVDCVCVCVCNGRPAEGSPEYRRHDKEAGPHDVEGRDDDGDVVDDDEDLGDDVVEKVDVSSEHLK